MRVAVGKARRLKANVRQQIAGIFAGLSGADAVDALAEGDALLHGQARIERSIAIWKTICTGDGRLSAADVTSRPLSVEDQFAAVWVSNCISSRAVVDLPQPDSPTTPGFRLSSP